MLKRTLISLTLALLLAGALVYGIGHLFALRYEKGDVYPPYSTLRADPLGAKGLYDALGRLPGFTMRRNYRPLERLKPAAPVTLVYAGTMHTAIWTEDELREFQSIVHEGSRAVFTFAPVERFEGEDEQRRTEKKEREKKAETKREEKERSGKSDENAKDEPAGKKKDESAADKEKDELANFREVAKRWGFSFDFLPADQAKNFARRALVADAGAGLEPDISWHTALHFTKLAPEWQAIYTCDKQPVVIERQFGNGSLVLAADSYFVSNEALRAERLSGVLTWLFSGPRDVVFDEEHHGVREQPGLASLARKYRLHGVVAGFFLISALFVWKNSVRFIPAYAGDDSGGAVIAGKEASEGFVNLLRRSIKPSEILEICVREWRRDFTHKPRQVATAEEALAREQARPARQRDPLATYRSLAADLNRKH